MTDKRGIQSFISLTKNGIFFLLTKGGKNINPEFKLPKPDCMDEMFEIAGKLSEGIPFLRVDLYCIKGSPYFGEATFFPASGFDHNVLPETEILFGNKIKIPINK